MVRGGDQVLHGLHKVLLFGFLYNMQDNCGSTTVQLVENAIAEPWFTEALRTGGVDAVVVLAHMHIEDPLHQTILAAIRTVLPNTPVQFLSGHSHYRDWKGPGELDSTAAAIESGHYFNTVGWVALDLARPTERWHRFIDTNVATLGALFGLSAAEFPTAAGRGLQADILRVRAEMGLDLVTGCNPAAWPREPGTPICADKSLWRVYTDQVLPGVLFAAEPDTPHFHVESMGGLRYTMHPGPFSRDDLCMLSPFGNEYFYLREVPGTTIAAMLEILNAQCTGESPAEFCTDNRGRDGSFVATSSSDPDRRLDLEKSYTLTFSWYDWRDGHGSIISALASAEGFQDGTCYRPQAYLPGLTSSTIWTVFSCRHPEWSGAGRGCARSAEACPAYVNDYLFDPVQLNPAACSTPEADAAPVHPEVAGAPEDGGGDDFGTMVLLGGLGLVIVAAAVTSMRNQGDSGVAENMRDDMIKGIDHVTPPVTPPGAPVFNPLANPNNSIYAKGAETNVLPV